MKKYFLAAFLVVSPLLAQSPTDQAPAKDQAEIALNTAGCGPSQISFDVTTDKNRHPLAQPEAGKALVYVISYLGNYITKIGVDGSWTGAIRPSSYFSFPVDPGDHHLCMSMQGDHLRGSAASFTAAAGQVYYFRSSFEVDSGWKLKVIDPAQAEFLIASSALSTSQPKK